MGLCPLSWLKGCHDIFLNGAFGIGLVGFIRKNFYYIILVYPPERNVISPDNKRLVFRDVIGFLSQKLLVISPKCTRKFFL